LIKLSCKNRIVAQNIFYLVQNRLDSTFSKADFLSRADKQ
jgi:hypothetical protein